MFEGSRHNTGIATLVLFIIGLLTMFISHAATLRNYIFTFFAIPEKQILGSKEQTIIMSAAEKKQFFSDHTQPNNWPDVYLTIAMPLQKETHWLQEIYQPRLSHSPTWVVNLPSPNVAKSPTPMVFAQNTYTGSLNDAGLDSPIPKRISKKAGLHPTVSTLNPPTTPPQKIKHPVYGYTEGAVIIGHLTNGYGDWFNQTIKNFTQIDPNNGMGLQFAHDYEYGEKGDYAVGEWIHSLNSNWYSNLGAGISNKTIFVPKYYIGGALFHKSGSQQRLISYLGLHAYWWRPIYSTEDINPGLIYYFNPSWVFEAGGYLNRSNPGTVYSTSGYLVLSQGTAKDHYFIFRYSFGKEAYLPLGPNVPGVFAYLSNTFTGTWRQWWGQQGFGTNIVAEAYTNRYYNRYGITLGIFKDFEL